MRLDVSAHRIAHQQRLRTHISTVANNRKHKFASGKIANSDDGPVLIGISNAINICNWLRAPAGRNGVNDVILHVFHCSNSCLIDTRIFSQIDRRKSNGAHADVIKLVIKVDPIKNPTIGYLITASTCCCSITARNEGHTSTDNLQARAKP